MGQGVGGTTKKTEVSEIVYELSDPKQITYLTTCPETCQGVK